MPSFTAKVRDLSDDITSIIFGTGFRILVFKKMERYISNLTTQSRYHFQEECTTVSFVLLYDYLVYSMGTLFELGDLL